MRLMDHFTRQPLRVSFGRGPNEGAGAINQVGLDIARDADSVTVSAADGSFVVVPGSNGVVAGVLTAAEKAKLDQLDPGAGPATGDFATRAEVAAAVVSPALDWLRTAGYHAAGDGGGGLYRRVASDPGHGLTVTSLDGAIWELVPVDGTINVLQAGARGDGTTDDWAAFDTAVKAFVTFEAATLKVRVPATPGGYRLGQTLEIKRAVVLEGDASGLFGGNASALLFPADTTGIIVHYVDTLGSGRDPAGATTDGAGTILRGLYMKGGLGTLGAADGIWLRSRARIEACRIERFARDGIRIVATAGSPDDSLHGNANNFVLESVTVRDNRRHGLFVDGADVNAGMANGVEASKNGRWGVYDSSFLGNTYLALHTATNGLANVGGNGAGSASVVSHNATIYYAAEGASEADLAATEPGTNPAVWVERGAGAPTSTRPAWQAAQPAGTYFVAGPFRSEGASSRNVFVGAYAEGDQAPAFLEGSTIVMGGLNAAGATGAAYWQDGTSVRGSLVMPEKDEARPLTLTMRPGNDDLALLRAQASGDHPVGFNVLRWNESSGLWDVFRHANLDARVSVALTTDLTTLTFGRSTAPDAGELMLPKGAFVGPGNSARLIGTAGAAPTTGEHARGDIRFNISPVAGGTAGWICVAGGTPGTWKAFGAIEP